MHDLDLDAHRRAVVGQLRVEERAGPDLQDTSGTCHDPAVCMHARSRPEVDLGKGVWVEETTKAVCGALCDAVLAAERLG